MQYFDKDWLDPKRKYYFLTSRRGEFMSRYEFLKELIIKIYRVTTSAAEASHTADALILRDLIDDHITMLEGRQLAMLSQELLRGRKK